jgi:hypothetical protein
MRAQEGTSCATLQTVLGGGGADPHALLYLGRCAEHLTHRYMRSLTSAEHLSRDFLPAEVLRRAPDAQISALIDLRRAPEQRFLAC